MREILLVSNSPGEVASWVRVAAGALRGHLRDCRLVLALVPCPFASGTEGRVARQLPELDQVLEPAQTVQLAAWGRTSHYLPERRGLVLHLGGEYTHALWLATRLGWSAAAYVIHPSNWLSRFRLLLVNDKAQAEELRQRHGSERVTWVGDLMVDGVTLEQTSTRAHPGPVLGLFPGSRPWHLRATLGHYLNVAEHLQAARPDLRFKLARSPFVSLEALEWSARHGMRLGRMVPGSGRLQGDQLVTEQGLAVEVASGPPGQVMAGMDLALTIPGTNTAELACAGVPFVICLHRDAVIGGGGLHWLLEKLPLGPLQAHLRTQRYRRARLVALPNLRAGREVAREVLIGEDTRELEEALLYLVDNPAERTRQGEQLRAVMGPRGAAERLARRVGELVP